MTSQEHIYNIPKIDLHCHLDGSFSLDFIKSYSNINMKDEELIKKLQAPADCDSLTTYLTCFDLPISCLQTKEGITNGVLDLIKQAAEENVKYIEIRFAPSCSVNSTLNYSDIYEAAIEGCKLGYNTCNIFSNIILCAMRHHSLETNLKVLHSAMDYLGHGICALDLAGDESAFMNTEFIDLFKEAKRLGMPYTIHSGECGSVDNIKVALELGAKRVGHGIALCKDSTLMKECQKSRLGLELCPTSNFQTRAVTNINTYPLRLFLDNGLLATVNTDNRTVSNTNMTKELHLSLEKLQIKEEDLITIYKNSIEISFADDNIKNQLYKLI
ncbi:MAG: adenosine deaminase [Lachnospiraceae bacterium]|nr:adenosine deaminase [Lachnospiraceae bacterium]